MLVLSREPGQKVYLDLPDGSRIVVCVTAVSLPSGKVKLGFDAPQDVLILRAELDIRESAKDGTA